MGHPLVSTRINEKGWLEVWILKSVSKRGATYEKVGTITKHLMNRAALHAK